MQFVSSFGLSLGFLYLYSQQECTGMTSFVFSYLCNASFLYLFIDFERRTYASRKKTAAAKVE